MKVFDIKSEYYALTQIMENPRVDPETGEVLDDDETLRQLLSSIESERDEKVDNLCYLVKEAEAEEAALKAEVKRLSERASAKRKEQQKLKELLDFLLEGRKVKTPRFTVYYARTKSVEIEDEGSLPEEFWKFEPKVLKTDIKKALQEGRDVPGARLVETIGIRIK